MASRTQRSSTPQPDLGFDEFSELRRNSGRLLNAISDAQITGAENLLNKASRHLLTGDDERAERLIQRAAQMPYDPRNQSSPGVIAAKLAVYIPISDEFERSQPDDMAWLDVVLDVYPGLDPIGQAEVSSSVHGFVLQSAIYSVTPAESKRITAAFGDAPLEADLGDEPDASVGQRHQVIRSLVLAANALKTAFAAEAGASPPS